MKKITACLIVLVFGAVQINAQSFQSGSLIIFASYGVNVYSLQQHDVNTFVTPHRTHDTTTAVGSGSFHIGGEYGVTKWLGLGLDFQLDSYFHGTNLSQANGVEYGLIANAHIIRHKHFDFMGGVNLGLSSLTLTWNDGYNDQIYGNGSWYDIHFTARIYVGRFGLNATLYFPGITYSNLTSNNNTFNEYYLASWKAKGEGLNIGVQYHFLN